MDSCKWYRIHYQGFSTEKETAKPITDLYAFLKAKSQTEAEETIERMERKNKGKLPFRTSPIRRLLKKTTIKRYRREEPTESSAKEFCEIFCSINPFRARSLIVVEDDRIAFNSETY